MSAILEFGWIAPPHPDQQTSQSENSSQGLIPTAQEVGRQTINRFVSVVGAFYNSIRERIVSWQNQEPLTIRLDIRQPNIRIGACVLVLLLAVLCSSGIIPGKCGILVLSTGLLALSCLLFALRIRYHNAILEIVY